MSGGGKLEVWLANISMNGVMIEATQSDFQTILANNKELHLNKPVEVDLKFKLPGDKAEPAAVNVRCRAIYVRRQSQNKYFIGFKFLKIAQRNMLAVKEYIDTNLSISDRPIAC